MDCCTRENKQKQLQAIENVENLLANNFKDFSSENIEEIKIVLQMAAKENLKDPLYLNIQDGEVVNIGDTHGKIDDLNDALGVSCGFLENNELNSDVPKVIFYGDFIDRGSNSIDIVLKVALLKIKHPNNVFMIMGNHELDFIELTGTNSNIYRCEEDKTCFYQELRDKLSTTENPITHKKEYNNQIANSLSREFSKFFESFPVAANVNDNFACHGGIVDIFLSTTRIKEVFKKNSSVFWKGKNEAQKIDKPIDIINCLPRNIMKYKNSNNTMNRILCEMLWNDPSPDMFFGEVNFYPNKKRSMDRGVSCFNKEAIGLFFTINKVNGLLRAHQCVDNPENEYQSQIAESGIITNFNATNYYGNSSPSVLTLVCKNGEKVVFKRDKGNKHLEVVRFVGNASGEEELCEVLNAYENNSQDTQEQEQEQSSSLSSNPISQIKSVKDNQNSQQEYSDWGILTKNTQLNNKLKDLAEENSHLESILKETIKYKKKLGHSSIKTQKPQNSLAFTISRPSVHL